MLFIFSIFSCMGGVRKLNVRFLRISVLVGNATYVIINFQFRFYCFLSFPRSPSCPIFIVEFISCFISLKDISELHVASVSNRENLRFRLDSLWCKSNSLICAKTSFERKAQGNSEMAYSSRCASCGTIPIFTLFIFQTWTNVMIIRTIVKLEVSVWILLEATAVPVKRVTKSVMEEATALVRGFFFISFFINSFIYIARKITIIAESAKKRVSYNYYPRKIIFSWLLQVRLRFLVNFW